MRTARLAEAAEQRLFGGFDEDQPWRAPRRESACRRAGNFSSCSPSRIHQQRGAFDFRVAVTCNSLKVGNQI
jgi:hypothetical protein